MENIILSAVHMLSNKTFKTTLSLIQDETNPFGNESKKAWKMLFCIFKSLGILLTLVVSLTAKGLLICSFKIEICYTQGKVQCLCLSYLVQLIFEIHFQIKNFEKIFSDMNYK